MIHVSCWYQSLNLFLHCRQRKQEEDKEHSDIQHEWYEEKNAEC
jgi:hypothetical protein